MYILRCIYSCYGAFKISKIASTIRILGIDPGTATVGFGIVDYTAPNIFVYVGSGVISTPKTLPAGARLKMIREDMLSIFDEYAPDQTAVEALFFFKNAKTVMPVAQARGVILEALSCRDHMPGEYTPMQVKLQISGYGKAEKQDVQWAVAKLLGLAEIVKPDDASDALAIAVCHARMSMFATPVERLVPVKPLKAIKPIKRLVIK